MRPYSVHPIRRPFSKPERKADIFAGSGHEAAQRSYSSCQVLNVLDV